MDKILVAICSCDKYFAKRQAVRQTWLTQKAEGIDARFFIGAVAAPLEEDMISLPVDDGYNHLPLKMKALYAYALRHFDFQWLFKCDDDTYLKLERLRSLTEIGAEFIGTEFSHGVGYASGGAGYMLSRRLVEHVVADYSIPDTGPEDVLISKSVLKASPLHLTNRLCIGTSRIPVLNNDQVTCHWCSPEKMQAVHTIATVQESTVLQAIHPHWRDQISFYDNGVFYRKSSKCMGQWSKNEANNYVLRWFDWGPEFLLPDSPAEGASAYKVVPLTGN
jgi:hypothetical protein